MTDNVILLVALVSFAVLVLGWMILPDATQEAAEAATPVIPRAVRAA